MNLLLLAYLGIVTVTVLIGAALSRFLGGKPATARYTMAFSAGVMLAVCLLYLIPDALQFQHGISQAQPRPDDHVSIGYALSVGFLSLLTIERFLLGAHDHGHDRQSPLGPAPGDHDHDHAPQRADEHDCRHDHEPPHHHQHDPLHLTRRVGLAWSTFVALWLHGLFDGSRTLYVKSYLRGAIGDALRKAGERNGPQVGAKLTVTFVRTEAPDRPGLSPSKHFECVYEKGAAGGGTDYYSGSTGATSASEPIKPAGITDAAWAGMDPATRAKVADSMAPF